MRSLKITLATAAACLAFAACSNDDDNNNKVAEADLSGMYNLTAFTVPEEIDFNQNGTASSNLMNESNCYQTSNIVLDSDHTYTAVLSYVDFSTEGGCNTQTTEGTWAVSGNTLTLTTIGEIPIAVPYAVSDNGGKLTAVVNNLPYPNRDENGNPVYSTGTVQLEYQKVQ